MSVIKKNSVLIIFLLFPSLSMILSCQEMRKNASKQIQYQQAQKAHNEGDFVKAIRIYQKLIVKEPDNEMYVYDLGMAYLDSKDFDGAKEQIDQLKKMDREDLAEKMESYMSEAKGLNNK